MGESVTEGSIVEWRVKPGQWIDEGATLVDVTTDKVDVEVPAPASGTVTQLFAGEGAALAAAGRPASGRRRARAGCAWGSLSARPAPRRARTPRLALDPGHRPGR